MVQIFAIFADRSASAKIKTEKIAASAISIAPRFTMHAGTAKIKTVKIFSGALRGDSTKFCTRQIFPLHVFHFTCPRCIILIILHLPGIGGAVTVSVSNVQNSLPVTGSLPCLHPSRPITAPLSKLT